MTTTGLLIGVLVKELDILVPVQRGPQRRSGTDFITQSERGKKSEGKRAEKCRAERE